MEHTKAPWKVSKLNPISIIDNSGNNVKDLICQVNGGRTREETDANAKLIAAAPEMLEILMALVGDQDMLFIEPTIENVAKVGARHAKIIELAREVIDKATK